MTGSGQPAQPLTPVDLLTGVPAGNDGHNVLSRSEETSRSAFESVLLDALRRPPCLVSFSGGRDSSALLGLAESVSRREGLPKPVPATLVFPGDASANEDEFQRQVLDGLDLEEWLRIEVADELDAVGPVAGPLLRRHGLLWPFNTHMHAPIIAAAAGGSVVTGFGGDEMASASSSARTAWVLARRRPPRPDDALVIGLALSPRPIRRAVELRRNHRALRQMPWLTSRARRRVAWERSAHNVSVPVRFDRRVQWWHGTRYRAICVDSFDLVGADYDVKVHHPFAAARVGAALAREGGFAGFGSRTALLERIFGDVMPDSVLQRTTKASFSNPLFTHRAAEFVASWDGSGLDPEWVDVEALQRHWRAGDPDVRTLPLLQQAWLSQPR